MAKRPTRPAPTSLGIPHIAVPRASAGLPSGGAIRAGHTGRYLILMEPSDTKTGAKALETGAGMKMMGVAGLDGASISAEAIPQSQGIVFHDLGIAVVNAAPDQYRSVSDTVAAAASLRTMEAERFVYAIGGFDASYLEGYRDAVDHLVDGILASRTGTQALSVQSMDETSLSWGLQITNVANSRFTGKGIKIAVLDTGLDLSHPDFAGRVLKTQSFVEGVDTVQDGHGHGTHCAGVACGTARPTRMPRFGVAPDADLFVGKVLNDAGTGTDSDIFGGLSWAIASGCDIVSMSLGAPVEQGTAFSPSYEQAAQRALAQGCLIIAAAGNDSNRPQIVKPVSHPANCPSIVAVAALDQQSAPAWFSNAGLNPDGGQVDIAAPGVDVISDWPAPDLYKSESGTSMATPHVAGIAALFAEANPGTRGRALLALLAQHARRLDAASTDVGSGLAQAP